MNSGQLRIRILSCSFTRIVNKSGKMSPYVKVLCGDNISEKTSALKKRTADFLWEEDNELTFHYPGNQLLIFEVWHKKKLFKDVLIGSGSFSLEGSLSNNSALETIPLTFEGSDAGVLQAEMFFTPDNLGTVTQPALVQTTQTIIDQPITQSGLVTEPGLMTAPVMTTDTKVIKHEPIITKENPVVFEKNIIREKPIITERTIVHSEQPIIVEKPELHERIVNEQAQPIVKTEQPIIRQEEGLIGEQLVGTPVVQSQTEYIREQPVFQKETPIIHQKDVIVEKPIIHEKDVIYREKPVIVEKPEIVEKHFYETQAPLTQTHDTLVTETKEVTNQMPTLPGETIFNKLEPSMERAQPMFKKEMPDIHETEVIHEKPLITEKQVLHTTKEVVHEKPEVHERRIFHQDPTLLKQDPLVRKDGVANQPNP